MQYEASIAESISSEESAIDEIPEISKEAHFPKPSFDFDYGLFPESTNFENNSKYQFLKRPKQSQGKEHSAQVSLPKNHLAESSLRPTVPPSPPDPYDIAYHKDQEEREIGRAHV